MRFSATLTLWMAVAFAALCLGYGIYGWTEIGGMPPGQERDDTRGFVMYWLFLGAVGVGGALVSWWMRRNTSD